jgi:hypothetical protein
VTGYPGRFALEVLAKRRRPVSVRRAISAVVVGAGPHLVYRLWCGAAALRLGVGVEFDADDVPHAVRFRIGWE